MLIELANHNDDIRRLMEKGYALRFDSVHLVVRDIPYLDSQKALQIGAFDCYEKPNGHDGQLLAGDGGMLARIIRLAARHGVRAPTNVVQRAAKGAAVASDPAQIGGSKKLIAIGASTGGVEALTKLLAQQRLEEISREGGTQQGGAWRQSECFVRHRAGGHARVAAR